MAADTPDPSIPDLGGLTPEQFLGPVVPGGGAPPAAPTTEPTGAPANEGWRRRYLEAFGGGVLGASPISAMELAAMGPAGIVPAAGTAVLGGISGVASQATEDLLGPGAISNLAGLAVGSALSPGRAIGTGIVSHGIPAVLGAGGFLLAAGEHLASSVLEGGMSHMAQLAPAAIGAATVLPLYRKAVSVFNRIPGASYRGPAAGFMGSVGQQYATPMIDRGVNQLSPYLGF